MSLWKPSQSLRGHEIHCYRLRGGPDGEEIVGFLEEENNL